MTICAYNVAMHAMCMVNLISNMAAKQDIGHRTHVGLTTGLILQ